MGILGNFMNASLRGIAAFRESSLNADPRGSRGAGVAAFNPWNRWRSRCSRYDLHWALYQNNAYRDWVHLWSAYFKTTYGLYKHVRHLYNPAYRLGEFWAGHLMGGLLDPEAGDGESRPSALPILADNQAIRPAIARLWRDSNWQVNKDVFTRWGAVLGDVALKVVDDTARGQVRLEVVHPGHLEDVEFDVMGNVRAYLLRRWEEDPATVAIQDLPVLADPQDRGRAVLYHERAYRDGEQVVYQTYKDGKPYAWNGEAAEWSEPYGFTPMVLVNHEAIGLRWGQCAWHAGLSRFVEIDDQASTLGDQNRKALKAPMLIAGAKGPAELKQGGVDRSRMTYAQDAVNPEPERTEQGFLYSPSTETKAHSLLAPMDVSAIIEHIRDLQSDVEKNYPELLADTGNLGGTVTAEAVRNARQRASSKVQARRVGYDDGLRRAHQMAVAIGGHRGYPGYEGFGLESYALGALDHQVGQRPVFEVDPKDSIEEDQAFWTAAGLAGKAGVPLPLYLERNGWSKEDLAALADAKAAEPPPVVAVVPGPNSPPAPEAP